LTSVTLLRYIFRTLRSCAGMDGAGGDRRPIIGWLSGAKPPALDPSYVVVQRHKARRPLFLKSRDTTY